MNTFFTSTELFRVPQCEVQVHSKEKLHENKMGFIHNKLCGLFCIHTVRTGEILTKKTA